MIDEIKLAAMRKNITAQTPIESIPPLPIFNEMADTIEQLWLVARAAERIIFQQEREYAPGSKKAALKAALEKLKEPPKPWKTETQNESAPVPSTEKTASMESEPILKSTKPEESDLKPSVDGGNA